MAHAPEKIRTFFVTSVTHRRHAFFQKADAAELLLGTLYFYRAQGRFEFHEFPPHEANCGLRGENRDLRPPALKRKIQKTARLFTPAIKAGASTPKRQASTMLSVSFAYCTSADAIQPEGVFPMDVLRRSSGIPGSAR